MFFCKSIHYWLSTAAWHQSEGFGLGFELVLLRGDGMRTVTQGMGVACYPLAASGAKSSEIMLHGIVAFVTLHEAVCTTNKHLPVVQRLIREEFARHGAVGWQKNQRFRARRQSLRNA